MAGQVAAMATDRMARIETRTSEPPPVERPQAL
jgi:hypothetical protein